MGVHIVNAVRRVDWRDVWALVATMFFGVVVAGGAALFGMFLLGVL